MNLLKKVNFIKEIKKHPWFNMEKNPIYKGINISKEKFPCSREVVQFILDNFFRDEKDINCDEIVKMVETHACNKYTSTYYLTKMNILGIDDEYLIMNNNEIDGKNNKNNIFIENNILKNDKIDSNKNIRNKSKNKSKERKFHKCRTKNNLTNNYNKIKRNILGLLNDDGDENEDKKEDNKEDESFHNMHLNENSNINKNGKRNIIVINNNIKKEKEKESYNIYIKNENNNNNMKNQDRKMGKQETKNVKLKNGVSPIKKTIKFSYNKKETILNQRNNKKIVYINKYGHKLNTVNELKYSNKYNTHRLKNKIIYDRSNINSLYSNSNEKKLIIKTNKNSYNKSLLNDKNNKNHI